MKANMGRRSIPSFILHLTARSKWVVTFRFHPLKPRKRTRWAPQPVWIFYKRQKPKNNGYTENLL